MEKLLQLKHDAPEALFWEHMLAQVSDVKSSFSKEIQANDIAVVLDDKERTMLVKSEKWKVKLYFVVLGSNLVVYKDVPPYLKLFEARFEEEARKLVMEHFENICRACQGEIEALEGGVV